MNKISMKFVAPFLFLFINACSAQNTKPEADSITGIWKGTSLCQVKNSPCHDETVVCYITKANVAGAYSVKMNKIVDNQELEMGGPFGFTYEKTTRTLSYKMTDRRGREGLWEFVVENNRIKGKLTLEGNTLYRLVDLTRTGS